MTPHKFDVNSLRVSSPCHAAWEEMLGDERKRFCSSCELNVYNVAGMTESEVARLIGAASGRVCMRLHRRPDGTMITRDCPVGLRAYRKRVAKFAGVTLSAILGFATFSFGQECKAERRTEGTKIERTQTNASVARIGGTAFDPVGGVVPLAEVELLEIPSGEVKFKTVADENGNFAINGVASGTYQLALTAPGFKRTVIDDLKIGSGDNLTIEMIVEVGEVMGVIEILPPPMIDMKTPGPTPKKLTREMIDRIPGGRPY